MLHLPVTSPYTLASSKTVFLAFTLLLAALPHLPQKQNHVLQKIIFTGTHLSLHHSSQLPEPQPLLCRVPVLPWVGLPSHLGTPLAFFFGYLITPAESLQPSGTACLLLLPNLIGESTSKHLILLLQVFLIFSTFTLLYHPLDSQIDRDTGIRLTLLQWKAKSTWVRRLCWPWECTQKCLCKFKRWSVGKYPWINVFHIGLSL